MFYCFVKKTINDVPDDEELLIQARYARSINSLIIYDSTREVFLNQFDESICIRNIPVLLRTSYEYYSTTAACIIKNGGILLEAPPEREVIQYWSNYLKPQRWIYLIRNEDLLRCQIEKDLEKKLLSNEYVFLKSSVKGFSKIIKARELLDYKSSFRAVIPRLNKLGINELIISENVKIAIDEYGKLEVRFIVLDNQIISASRFLHSKMHDVDTAFFEAAGIIISNISAKKGFPNNYVLDLAEIVTQNGSYIDVIEFNPISTALCYVNNTIFTCASNVIRSIHAKTGFGYEYCYDFLEGKNTYFSLNDKKNADYTYYIERSKLLDELLTTLE
jgi:hypothetical protein